MNAPAAKPAAQGTTLAERIYIELIGRAFLRMENNAVFKPDPAQLAKLSLELAAEFEKADAARRAALGPKNVNYDVRNLDLGQIGG